MLGEWTRIRFNSKKSLEMIASSKTKWIYIGWNFVDDGYFVEYVRGKVDVNRKKDARVGSEGRNSWRQVVHVVQIDVFLTKPKNKWMVFEELENYSHVISYPWLFICFHFFIYLKLLPQW